MTYTIPLSKRTPEEQEVYFVGIITENVMLKKQIKEANKILDEEIWDVTDKEAVKRLHEVLKQ